MNGIDWVVIGLAMLAAYRGYQIGFLRQFASTLGFIGGLLLGSFIANILPTASQSDSRRALIGIIIPLTIGFMLMTVCEIIAVRVRSQLQQAASAHRIDSFIGSTMSMLTLVIVLAVASTVFLLSPTTSLHAPVRQSKIISLINRRLPSANTMLTSLNKLIDPNASPQVFTGHEPSPDANYDQPSIEPFSQAVESNRAAIVKISGLGCGGIVNGSGFVFAPERVVTNAHVIAGVRAPKVESTDGIHDASVMWFDKDNDIAVLRVFDLAVEPLQLSTDRLGIGASALIAGYPEGGSFQTQTTVVLDNFQAIGRDIYGRNETIRSVYSLQAHVVQGNSGGPMLDTKGKVVGIVFATSTAYNNIGYALTSSHIQDILREAADSATPHATGECSE